MKTTLHIYSRCPCVCQGRGSAIAGEKLQFTAQQIQSFLTREKWASPKPREIKASRGVRGEMKIVAPQVTSFEI
jgi:hypothetical protein